MTHDDTARAVGDALRAAFAGLDARFDRPAESLHFRPAAGWTPAQVLEHVALTNRFLLLTLAKHAATAQKRARRGDPVPEAASDLARLEAIGERGSFAWVRPDHMEPTGVPGLNEVRATLRTQLAECLAVLDRLAGGVGTLARVTMTVNGLGKIDLYQWLHFVALHARRHLQQLDAIESEYARHASE